MKARRITGVIVSVSKFLPTNSSIAHQIIEAKTRFEMLGYKASIVYLGPKEMRELEFYAEELSVKVDLREKMFFAGLEVISSPSVSLEIR